MSEITLENIEPPPVVEEPENDEMPAIVEEAFIGPSAQQAEQVPPDIEEELAMPQESIVVKKPRGRPKGPPKPKPEPKKRGRPPIESNPEPRPSYEAPATWDMAAYNQSLINALVAHSQSSKVQRHGQRSSLVKL